MAEKTGFDKFISKQVGTTVAIRPKANTKPVEKQEPAPEPAPAEEVVVEAPQPKTQVQTPAVGEPVKKHAGGRPRKDPSNQPKLVTLNFQVDEELKQILENLKYRTHKSSVKGVVMEAIDLLLDKYGIER